MLIQVTINKVECLMYVSLFLSLKNLSDDCHITCYLLCQYCQASLLEEISLFRKGNTIEET